MCQVDQGVLSSSKYFKLIKYVELIKMCQVDQGVLSSSKYFKLIKVDQNVPS